MATNEALAEYLALHHKGEANAVTSRELECSFQMRGSELRREINALRGDGIPICSFEGGYYYAATAEELERTIRQLRSRIKKIAFAERGLSSALPDYVDTTILRIAALMHTRSISNVFRSYLQRWNKLSNRKPMSTCYFIRFLTRCCLLPQECLAVKCRMMMRPHSGHSNRYTALLYLTFVKSF